jgi:hypothetical protein
VSFESLLNKCNAAVHGKFAVAAVITEPGHADKPVSVVFDLNPTDIMGVISDKPQIIIKDADLIGVDRKTATITVTGKYPAARMTKPEADGTGWSITTLTRA